MYRYRWSSLLRETCLLLLAVAFLVPVYFLVAISVKPATEVVTSPLSFPKDPVLTNYSDAWNNAGSGSGLGDALITSVVITVVSLLLLLVVGTLCAYVVVRRPSRTASAILGILLLGLILPFQLGILPLYSAMNDLGLIGARVGVILVYLGQLTPLTVFLLTGFMRKLPRDYEEAAEIDGAGLARKLVTVVAPLLRPALVTVAILDGLIIWNDFFVPLIWLSGADHVTTPVAIFGFVGQFGSEWNVIFAGIVIAVAPVLIAYLALQRFFMRGFASGVRG